MDIQWLIEEASQSMLTSGSVMPMLYLEFDDNSIHMFALDIINDSQSIPAQCGILARLGWEECKKQPEHKPIAAAFTAEAWRVRDPESDDEKLMPVKSTRKQEIITVQAWQANHEPHEQLYTLPVIRDHKKRVIDVGPASESRQQITYQLAAFRQGCLDAAKPDEEVFGKMESAISKRIASMPPEMRKKLTEYLRHEGIDPNHFMEQ